MRSKLFSLFAVVMIAALVLGACAKPTAVPTVEETAAPVVEETEAPVVEEPTEAPVVDPWADVVPAKEITFWHNHSGDREPILQKVVDDFNATNEWGITVKAEMSGKYDDIYKKMLPVLNTADVPDIVVGYQNQIAMYQLDGAIWDMNEIIDNPTYGLSAEDQADFLPTFFKQDVYSLYDNQRLGLAPNRSMEVMYYNLSWLKQMGYEAPPTTVEEFKQMACDAVANPFEKGMGEDTPVGYAVRMDASNFASWVFAFGGDIFDYTTNQFTLDSPEAVEAWTFLQDLARNGCLRVVDGYDDQKQFGQGTNLFTVASSSGLGVYYPKAIADGVGEMEWSVAALPTTTGQIKANIYGASVSIPKSTPERQLAAWLFIKYYTSKDVQTYWATETQYFPVRKSVAAEMVDFFGTYPPYETAWNLIEFGAFEPPVPGYDPIREEMKITMAALLEDPTLIVQDELTLLNTTANQILADQLAQIEQ